MLTHQFQKTVLLRNGIEMPTVGLGLWKVKTGEQSEQAVHYALNAGYRLFDSAKIYGNEESLGKAIKSSDFDRQKLFITTKLWNEDHGYDKTMRAFETSLKTLQLDYLDLYLIHFPVAEKRLETWKAMIEISKSGRCRAIGVSNYTIRHLEEIRNTYEVQPEINQVEFHPFLYQKDHLEYCQKQRIQLEAYSPLVHGHRQDDDTLQKIADTHLKTISQVMLRWNLQRGLVIIPKSTQEQHIQQNIDLFNFTLSEAEMKSIDDLNENFRTCWDPTDV